MPAEFVALTVKSKLPTSVGDPESLPELASSVRPGGKRPAEMLNVIGVVPVVMKSTAVIGEPTTPSASGEAGAVIEGATAFFLSSSQPVKKVVAITARVMAGQVLKARMSVP